MSKHKIESDGEQVTFGGRRVEIGDLVLIRVTDTDPDSGTDMAVEITGGRWLENDEIVDVRAPGATRIQAADATVTIGGVTLDPCPVGPACDGPATAADLDGFEQEVDAARDMFRRGLASLLRGDNAAIVDMIAAFDDLRDLARRGPDEHETH